MKVRSKERGKGFQPFGSPLKLCAIFAVLAVLSLGIVIAVDGSEDSSAAVTPTYTYDSNNMTATVTGGSGSGDLTIPATVTYSGQTYRVTEIGINAFNGRSNITSLTLGSNIEYIGQWGFNDCTGLTSVTLPDSVKELANQAFLGCTGLTSINLGSVEKTGNQAFGGCTKLTSITLPSTLTFIRQSMFNGCTSLVSADLSALQYPMTQFEGSTFYGCTSLTSVSLPTGMDEIPTMMFVNCTSLTSFVVPDKVTKIDSAFLRCANLESITIPASVTSFGSFPSFDDCTSLKAIAVPSGVNVPGYTGKIVYYTGANSVTAHSTDGIAITVDSPDRLIALSLVDSAGNDVPYSGSIDSWTFTYPSAASYVTMTLDALDLKIYTVDDLKKIGVDPAWTMDRNYIVMNTIPFTSLGNPFTPIGTPANPFTGTFNGGKHMITSMVIDTTSTGLAAGLFGYVGGNAEIFDVVVRAGSVTAGSQAAGGIVGTIIYGSSVTITGCFNFNTITSAYIAGGIVGLTYGGTTIDLCRNNGSIGATSTSGYAYAGGIVGYVNGTSASKVMISDSDNNVDVGATAPHSRSGGIAGFARHMVATDCTNAGEITGDHTSDTGSTTYVGGMVGRLESSSLEGCINESTGSIGIVENLYTGSNHSFGYWLGGIAGDMVYGSTIVSCANEATVIGNPPKGTSQIHLGGIVGCMYQGTSVTYCTNSNVVDSIQDRVRQSELYIYAGGIAGAAVGTDALGASITGCMGMVGLSTRADLTITGTYVRAGGILGYGSYATVSDCEGISVIIANAGSRAYGITDASARIGGIAGYLENSTLSNCNSSGSVTAQTEHVNGVSEAGGIVGRMSGLASFMSGCTNVSDVSSANEIGYAYAGGIAGALVGGVITADDCVNLAPVSVSSPNARAGGIAGLVRGVTMTDSYNAGTVIATNTFVQDSTIYLGGIAGRLENSSLIGCSNTSTIEVTTAVNPWSYDSFRYWLGGIAGDMTYEASLFECYNMADVSATVPNGTTYVYMGGLVGCMYQGTSAVDCTSSGDVSSVSGSVPGLFAYVGGAVGAATGTSSMGVEITNCDSFTSSPARVDVTVTAANARAGGILGYGLYATVSDCDFIGAVVGAGGSVAGSISSASVRSGGIAGYLEHSNLTACTVGGSVSAVTLNSNGQPRAGGIVGSMVMDTVLSDSLAFSSVMASAGIMTAGKAYAGGIAGLTEGTIRGCTYGAASSLGTVTSVGFESGAGGLAGMVSAGMVSGIAHADVSAQFTESIGKGRAGAGAGYAMSSASVVSTGSTGYRNATPIPLP